MGIGSRIARFFRNRWATMCRRWHYVLLGIPFVLVIAGIILCTVSVIRIHQVLDGQPFQYAAELFESRNMNYRKLTILSRALDQADESAPRSLPGGLDLETVKTIHNGLEEKEASTNLSSRRDGAVASDDGQIWLESYFSSAFYRAYGYIDKTEQGAAERVEVVGIGGDYATLHPFRYESGGFFSDGESDKYSIVLNTQLAWNLFHSYQVLGAEVELNGVIYQVVGVVCEGDDMIAETTGVTKPRAYVHFNQLANLANGGTVTQISSEQDQSVKPDDLAVTCYEALLTDPINNIAYNDLLAVLTENIGYSDDSTTLEIINNTDRFFVTRLYEKYFPLKESVNRIDGLHIPFFERSARLAEQYVVFWAEMLVVCGIVIICGLCGIYSTLHGRKTKHALPKEEDTGDVSESEERKSAEESGIR